MAITVYFIDKEWNYREMLLGFEPLHGPHTGVNLCDVLLQLLRERQLLNRIFSVTTDNATNNETLSRALQDTLISSGGINSRDSIIRVPCMAHVIQLCLKQLLGHIRAAPKNQEIANVWSDSQVSCLRDSADDGDVAHTLTKVKTHITQLTTSNGANITTSFRFVHLRSLSTPAPSGVMHSCVPNQVVSGSFRCTMCRHGGIRRF